MITEQEKIAFRVGLAVASTAASHIFAEIANGLKTPELLDTCMVNYQEHLENNINAIGGIEAVIESVPKHAPKNVSMESLIEQARK